MKYTEATMNPKSNHKDSRPPPGDAAARKQKGLCTLSDATARQQGGV